MSAFSESFLRENASSAGWWRRLTGGGATPPSVALGAWGKHPGWDDHLDGIGLTTRSLAWVKQRLYVEGIGGQLNAGAWDKLAEAQRLPAFGHVFLWRRAGGAMLGRLWSSTDRKGRSRYPMVACAELHGLPLSWTLDHVLPRLEEIERACGATKAAEAVGGVLATEQQVLQQAVNGVPPAANGTPVKTAVSWPSGWPPAGTDDATLRVLRGVRRRFGHYAPGRGAGDQPGTLRISCLPGGASAEILRTWAAVFDALLDPGAPVLFLLPVAGGWLDVVAGEPVSESFFALRATPAALPPVDRDPSPLEDGWRRGAGAFLAGVSTRRAENGRCARQFWRLQAG